MRANLLAAALVLPAALAGCKWTEFDDLADETWVKSLDEPDVGSTDYAVAIAGISGASGGQLAVISRDRATYSTVDLTQAGQANYGSNPVNLEAQNIVAVSDTPVYAASGTKIGYAERSRTGGNLAVVRGDGSNPGGIEFQAADAGMPPTAAAFVGTDFAFVAGTTLYKVPESGTETHCALEDSNMLGVTIAAMAASDATNVWLWSSEGGLYRVDVTSCTAATPLAVGTSLLATSGIKPGAGSRAYLEGTLLVLVAVGVGSTTGQVYVVDIASTPTETSTMTVEGLKSSTVGTFDGTTAYVAVGKPNANVGGVAAGIVDLYAISSAGVIDASAPALTLHDAEPESGQMFGRALATVSFNGQPIVAVGANNEIFAYLRTALYDQQP